MNTDKEKIKRRVIVGDWQDYYDSIENDINLLFRVSSINESWDSIGQITNFLAHYYISYLSKKWDVNGLLFILNEIIENAVKYSKSFTDVIEIKTYIDEDKSLLMVTNRVTEEDYIRFIDSAVDLFSKDLTENYISKLQSLHGNSNSGGIGLIILKKDYDVDICFRFTTDYVEYKVTTIVEL